MRKMTSKEIMERFDNEVERFSNLETGQTSTIDSSIVLEMIADNIALVEKGTKRVCDIGCGAGNFTMKIIQKVGTIESTIIDLSEKMLDRAEIRIRDSGNIVKGKIQGDIREIKLPKNSYDIVVAAAVLHHLRNKSEWKNVLKIIYESLDAGGNFLFWDLIKHDIQSLQIIQERRYSDYLINLKDENYKNYVFDYIEKEDTPESIPFIFKTMLEVGFKEVDIIHKNSLFAALIAIK